MCISNFSYQRASAPRPVSNEFLSSVVSSLQAGLGGGPLLSSNGSISSGAGGGGGKGAGAGGGPSLGYPPNATQNEIKIWDNTQKAFMNEEVCTYKNFSHCFLYI